VRDQNKLSGRVGLDTTDFKTGLAGMNRELRILESGFRASAAELDDWAKDASGLEMRIKALTSSIDIQKNKVAAVRAEYERVAAEKGANSRAAQDLEIKLNKETETLGKMENELGNTETALEDMRSGSEETGKSAEEMGDKGRKSGDKVETFKKVLSGVGAVAKAAVMGIAAMGAAAIAAVAAIAGLGFNAAKTAEELADLSVQTGIGTTRLQELKYAGEILGTDLDTITGANSRLIRSMASAQDATGEQAQAFAALGVSVTDSNGQLRDSQVVFGEVLDRLNAIQNPTERDALAMALFGRSAQELNPLIAAGSDELARLSAEAHNMGAVMSEESVQAAAAFQDQLDGLKMGFQGVLAQIGMAFIPGMSGIADQVKGYLLEVVGVVQGADGDIGKMATGLGELLGKIATDLVTALPKLASVGLSVVQSILTAITAALPTLITAAVGIINTLVEFLVQNLPMLVEAAIQIVMALLTAILEALPTLVEAALQIIITLANGIAEMLPKLIPTIVEVLVLIIETILDNLPMLLKAALELILGLVQGIYAAMPILIKAVPTIMIAIVDTLTEMLPVLVEMAPEIIIAIITGVIGALPALAEAIPQIIATIIRVLTELLPNILIAGANIVIGLVNGIISMTPWFIAKIRAFALSIWSTIKSTLGMSSPSKLFADTVGPFIPAGIWEGIESGMPKLQDQLAAAMRGLAGTYDIAVNGRTFAGAAAGAGMVNSNNRSVQFVNHIANAGIDARELERIQRRQEMLYGG